MNSLRSFYQICCLFLFWFSTKLIPNLLNYWVLWFFPIHYSLCLTMRFTKVCVLRCLVNCKETHVHMSLNISSVMDIIASFSQNTCTLWLALTLGIFKVYICFSDKMFSLTWFTSIWNLIFLPLLSLPLPVICKHV